MNKYRLSKLWKKWAEETEEAWLHLLTLNYPEITLDDISDDEIELTTDTQRYLYSLLQQYSTYEECLAAN